MRESVFDATRRSKLSVERGHRSAPPAPCLSGRGFFAESGFSSPPHPFGIPLAALTFSGRKDPRHDRFLRVCSDTGGGGVEPVLLPGSRARPGYNGMVQKDFTA